MSKTSENGESTQILVTGATGNVGSLVVQRLRARGMRPRVFVRDPDAARAKLGDGVDLAVGDLADAASLSAALAGPGPGPGPGPGIDALFLLTSGPELARLDAGAARVARDRGVRRIVKLSTLDAAQGVGTGPWHARGEAAIRDSGVAFTFVRPTGFMTNALYWARAIRADGVVRSSTGDGRIPFIHPHDIADVSLRALVDDDLEGQVLPITGPAALSYGEMTAAIAEACGRPLRFEPIDDEAARRMQVAWVAEPAMVEARLAIFRAIRAGELAAVTDTVERVLGRTPIPFARWARDNAAAFQ